MSQCSEKMAPLSAAGRISARVVAAVGRKMRGASRPETARIVRENRLSAIFEFFRDGSRLEITPGLARR